MFDKNVITIARGCDGSLLSLEAAMACRHGLIAGATGTGKTVTLQRLAEGFSTLGVPVFTADVKGDLAGLATAGSATERLQERILRLDIKDWSGQPFPAILWDVFGKRGVPVRTTISEIGPLILSRMLGLNDTQSQVLELVFRLADDQGLLLLDLKDLRQICAWAADNLPEVKESYGAVAAQTLGAIQRAVGTLGGAGGEALFGEPGISLAHLMQKDFSGRGVISVLDAVQLLTDTRLYSSFLLWLLSELFEQLPEVGEVQKPKIVFFFDEAHLLFNDTPAVLVEKIEQVVRLIRSKGVGVFFVTQNPSDIPGEILGQLGNRVQHALRAYTPKEEAVLKAAARTFRTNPALNTEEVIKELEVGEALVSFLDARGTPRTVERAFILPPASRIGPISDDERSELINRSPLKGVYSTSVDRESAFEVLKARSAEKQAGVARETGNQNRKNPSRGVLESLFSSGSRRQSLGEAMVKSVARSVGSTLGREIVRGLLGSMRGRSR